MCIYMYIYMADDACGGPPGPWGNQGVRCGPGCAALFVCWAPFLEDALLAASFLTPRPVWWAPLW